MPKSECETGMTRIRIGLRKLAAIVILAVAVISWPASAQNLKIASAYEQLSMSRLIKQLSLLGMTDLLRAIEAEIPAADESVNAWATRGRVRMGLANAMARPEDQNRVMDEAIVLLRKAADKAEGQDGKSPGDRIEMYRIMLELVTAMGRYRVENPHILRLRMLLGSEADRKIILKYTKEAVERADYLGDKVPRTLVDWQTDIEIYVMYGPKLEDLQLEMRYNVGWVRLHRAMALPPGSERAELCRNVLSDMKEFCSDPESGVMGWAMYATGIARRLLGEHAEAEAIFKKIAEDEKENKDLRQRAWFERVHNRIDEGADAKIDKALADFEAGSIAIWGQDKRVIVDLRLVLLRSYRIELAAMKETNVAKRKALFAQAQAELLSFVEKYADRPDLIRSFLEMVNTKFSGDTDLTIASAIVCMARAYAKLSGETPEDKAEAEVLLKRVLGHKDLKNPKIAQAIEPGVLYELAFMMNKRKLNIEAAKYFVRLALKYPKHDLAEKSALYAVRSLYGVFVERQTKGEVITSSLRMDYIRALETLLGNWPKAEGTVKWNFDLAAQCTKLADLSEEPVVKFYWQIRAIAANENVPSDLLEYMEAQYAALEARSQIVLNRDELDDLLKGDNARTTQSLRRLAQSLVELDEVALPAADSPTTAPATAPADEPKASVDAVGAKVTEIAKELTESLATYADPAALSENLKKYAVEALAESEKAASKARTAQGEDKEQLLANAKGLKEWAAEADYKAAVIKYEQLPRGKLDEDRKRIEQEALGDMRALITKWEGTPILRKAHEFEIRKLIELGRTDEAIVKIQDFKKSFPEQAKQLIELLVEQVQVQIVHLENRLETAVTREQADGFRQALNRYQTAYINFAKDLYMPAAGKPLKLAELDALLRDLRAMEQKGDFDGLLAQAQGITALAAANEVKLDDIKKSPGELANVIAGVKPDGSNRKAILPDLAKATTNMVLDIRDVVSERYELYQMYADSLLCQGRAEILAKNEPAGKAAYQNALDVFKKCFELDAAGRKGKADWLAKKYAPFIEDVKSNAKSMDAVTRMVQTFRRELVAAGEDPNSSADMSSMVYAEEYVRGAADQGQERQRLPRAVDMLVRGWQNLLRRLQNQTTVDHVNIIGMARAHRGLGEFGEALKQYRHYTAGIPEKDHPKIYWRAELERSQCHLEGYENNVEAMNNLVIQIKSLSVKNKDMGGLAAEFEKVKNKAASKAALAASKKG